MADIQVKQAGPGAPRFGFDERGLGAEAVIAEL